MTNMPTLQVLLDDGTGTFPFDISSKVMAEGWSYNRGRADWQGGVTYSRLSLTLNNSDGRFTRGSTTIASPSPIKVDQRIRIKETINGSTFTRFTGYVKSWPVAWPAVVPSFAVANITATDAQARAERYPLPTAPEQLIMSLSPVAYYPLDEPEGAVAGGDRSGNQNPLMAQAGSGTAPVFGEQFGASGLTAAGFAAGKILIARGVPAGSPAAWSYVMAFASTAVGTGNPLGPLPNGDDLLYLNFLGGSGNLGSLTTGSFSSGLNDGAAHVFAISYSGGVATAYVDGVSVTTFALTIGATAILGAGGGSDPSTGSITPAFTGSIGQVAFWTSALTPTQMADISTAIRSGYPAELTSARTSRIAGVVGVPLGTIDTGLTTMPTQETAGISAWDAVQQAVDAEMGAAFVDELGQVDFHNRNRGPAKTTPDFTLAAQYVAPDVQPVDDDQQILNYVETTSTATGVQQVVRNATSETTHGRYSDSKSYLVSTDAEALDRANWIVANFAEPTTRYGSLTVNLHSMTPALAASFLTALDIDMWLRVTGAPTQNPGGTSVDVVVQGWTEASSTSENTWTVTLNVVARSLFTAWILGDSTYGVLDSTTRLYV